MNTYLGGRQNANGTGKTSRAGSVRIYSFNSVEFQLLPPQTVVNQISHASFLFAILVLWFQNQSQIMESLR
jgi:hypothetical protein